MTAPAPTMSSGPAAASAPAMVATPMPPSEVRTARLLPIIESLSQLGDDASVPRNVRRGAQAAREELGKSRVALDVRIAGAVSVLDDLANDPNIPTHGRTAIWSIISSLESVP